MINVLLAVAVSAAAGCASMAQDGSAGSPGPVSSTVAVGTSSAHVSSASSAPSQASTETPDGFPDPGVCAAFADGLTKDEKAYEDSNVNPNQTANTKAVVDHMLAQATTLLPKAAGPLALLVDGLVLELANDRDLLVAGKWPTPRHRLPAVVAGLCGAHAGNTWRVAVCDRFEQDFAGVAAHVAQGMTPVLQIDGLVAKTTADAGPINGSDDKRDNQLRADLDSLGGKYGLAGEYDANSVDDSSIELAVTGVAQDCSGTTLPSPI